MVKLGPIDSQAGSIRIVRAVRSVRTASAIRVPYAVRRVRTSETAIRVGNAIWVVAIGI